MSTTTHAFTDDALGEMDAVALAAAIRDGQVGRAEVIEAAIERAQRVNPQLNAIQAECFARARAAQPASGVFSGVPAFVKDNTDIAGLPTCHGSAAFDPHPAARTSGPGAQFLHPGFVALGKSTLPEFGLTASTEYADRPPTRNPWNTDYSAGASSGGSAALVAAGVVPIAHANDGGGSTRIPAAANGLVGLKPTRNRLLDQPGARQLPVHLVAEGVLTRSVRDTAHYLAAAERFHTNTKLPPIGLVEGPSERRLRIGVIRHDVRGRAVHEETGAILDSAAAVFAGLGHELVETRLQVDEQFIEDFKLYWAAVAALLSTSFRIAQRKHFDPSLRDPFTKGLSALATSRPLSVMRAVRRLRTAPAIYDAHFTDVDVLLTPVLSHPAPLLGDHSPNLPFDELFAKLVDYVGFTPLNNVGGGPAVSLPHGRMSANLPGSIQLSARHGAERTLLDLAYQFEAASPFPRITDVQSAGERVAG
ncbi:amidase [Nocardia cyriacigeorgica]|uniref:amidase n=1 Tax=Nocardia cyriacigeorgica TaxID=135487 RepID=UPI0013D29882|nr:amidase [Nocardia cyriacigeorgica]MBF6437537.1 amidase [Nocardia cyriacigeorgica]MBF6453105.1 amidase [Nocardia cyriacigeorgica]MBF6478741.1 amidase [Nocardia cyriacigeorgica]MBF6550274.1 amidase [Nocardia cyriacigeorgica]NEW29597.1 amidase [Nocardia cyriacigeorgica]